MTGITGYINKKGIRTFRKVQLKEILEEADFKYKPNEERLEKYTPYLSEENTMVEFDEKKAYEEVIKNNQFEFFANSFFIEASMQEFKTDVNLENQDLAPIDDETKEFYKKHFRIKEQGVQENTELEKKLMEENQKLKEELNAMANSKSWKITKPFRRKKK